MKSSKRAMKKALSVLLSAAETLSSDSGKVAATASDAEKEDKKDDITVVEEPLDEEGFLLDGNISDDLFIDPDQVEDAEFATVSNALRAKPKRKVR